MISSITERVGRFLNFQRPDHKYKFREFQFEDPDNETEASELASWIILDEEAGSYANGQSNLSSQIHKRWIMATANYNALLGTFLGFFIALLLVGTQHLMQPKPYWITLYLVVWIIFILIFWFNGQRARLSVLRMDKLLAIRHKK